MKPNPHAVPGGSSAVAEPTMKTVCTVTWKDGAKVVGELSSRYEAESAPVAWSGDVHRLDWILPGLMDAGVLTASLGQRAKELGAKMKIEFRGQWMAKDEVLK